MITLHGFAYSNYHNIVKHTLMLKGIPFEEHIVYPNAPDLLTVNPTGKVPAMTTESGACLAESSVLVEYLEDAYPEVPLFPEDAEARARVRQLMKVSELYLDLPSRRLLPAVFSNTVASDALTGEVRAVLDRGVRAVSALAQFAPYLAGDTVSLADIYVRYALAIPKMVGPAQLNWDILAQVQGLSEWDAMMADSDISRSIDADLKDNAAEFMAYVSGAQ